jgi:transposase
VVAAPSKIPRATGDKVKNDRRDAEHLVRLLLAGKLHPVRVPAPKKRRCAISFAPGRHCAWI